MRSHLPSICSVLLLTVSFVTAPSSAKCGNTGPQEDAARVADAASARVSNALNPAISFNALLGARWRNSDTGDPANPAEPLAGRGTGLALDEGEVIFTSTVDSYFKADAIVAIEDEDGEYAVDLEEVFVTALALPRGFGLRAGKMYPPLGRHNLLHQHQFPFIDPPLVSERLLGDEGLNEAALEGSALLPTSWFSQLVAVVGDGRNEDLFGGAEPGDLMFLGHWKNVWDVSDSATLELGASALYGKRGADDGSSRVYAGNLTYKWRPARLGMYRALELQAELMHRASDETAVDSGDGVDKTGGYAHARWQLARRWWLQGRYDRVDHEGPDDESRWSALVAFVPTEFSSLRFEYATLDPIRGDRDHQLLAQLNFTIGSHPAHGY